MSSLKGVSLKGVYLISPHPRPFPYKQGPWLPEQPYKPESISGWVWCPFSFYRSSLDIRVDYGGIFGVNLQTVIPLAAEGLSYPGCRAYPDMLEVRPVLS